MKARFTEFKNNTDFVSGVVNDGEYTFEAKLHDVGSWFGIERGRVSELSIKNDFGYVVDYKRGWDIELDEGYREVFDVVMELLENSPKRFE